MPDKHSLPAEMWLTDVPRWQPAPSDFSKRSDRFCLVLRHPDDDCLLAYARAFRHSCYRTGQKRLVARNLYAAISGHADGLHLAEYQLFRRGTFNNRLWKKRLVITAACHSRQAIRVAGQMGIRAVLLSPVRQTNSHPQQEALSSFIARAHVRNASMPVYALGGMRRKDTTVIKKYGFYGIAGVSLGQERQKIGT